MLPLLTDGDFFLKEIVPVAFGFLVGAFFGLTRHAYEWFYPGNGGEKPPCSWPRMGVKGNLAGLAGVVAVWTCQEFKVSPYMSAVIISLSGWGGIDFFSTVKDFAYDSIRRWFDSRSPPRG